MTLADLSISKSLTFTMWESETLDGEKLVNVSLNSNDEWGWTGTEDEFIRLFLNVDLKQPTGHSRLALLIIRLWSWRPKARSASAHVEDDAATNLAAHVQASQG